MSTFKSESIEECDGCCVVLDHIGEGSETM